MNTTQSKQPTTQMKSFPPLKAGNYKVKLKDFRIKETSSGTGTLGSASFEILDGAAKGRLIFHNFNLTNVNAQAVEISSKQLNQLLQAAGTGEDMNSLGEDVSGIQGIIGEVSIIVDLERKADFKNAEGKFIKLNSSERKELEGLMDDELEDRGVTKIMGNRIKKFLAA